MAAIGSLCFSSLFLTSFMCLGFSGLSGLKLEQDLYAVPQKPGEAGCLLQPSFHGEGNFSSEVLSLC